MKQIIAYLQNKIKGKAIAGMIEPYYEGFKGKIISMQSYSWGNSF